MTRCRQKPFRTKHQAQVAIVGAVILANIGQAYKKKGDRLPTQIYWHPSCGAYHITPSKRSVAS